MFTTTAIFALALLGLTSASPIPSTPSIEKRFSGARMTYYDTEVGLGACGAWHSNSEFTVALNTAQFGSSYPSQYCGQTITISYGGKTTQASIQDACPSCPYGGLDLSEGLFSFFADQGVGVIYGNWDFGGSVQQQQPTTSQAPTSTYVPPPSTSSTPAYTPPTTSQTPTSTYVPPTTSSTPAPSPSTSSTPAAASSSSSSSPVSSSVSSSVATTAASSAATTASTTDVNSILANLATASTATLSLSGAAASATATGGAGAVDVHSNLETLSGLIVNMGRIVVLSG